MNEAPTQYRISPESAAYKRAALFNFYTPKFAAQVDQHPRMIEVPCFLEWVFRQPGGSVKFAQDFVETFAGRIGTPAMHRIGRKSLSDSEREEIIDSIPRGDQDALSPGRREASEFFRTAYDSLTPAGRAAAEFFDTVEPSATGDRATRRARDAFKRLDCDAFHAFCVKVALADLPWHLARFCGLPDAVESLTERHWTDNARRPIEGEDRPLEDVWYFRDLPGAMIEYLEIHAERAARQLAKTAVAEKVIKEIEYARENGCVVSIHGQSRFGKTHAAAVYCDMHPGVARRVRTPCSNGLFDLLRAIAEAFGLEVPLGMTRRELQRKVEFLIRHSGLFLVFDEAHYLFPRNVARNTSPVRLDFIREHFMEDRRPLVLVSTPQEFSYCMNRFTTATNHNVKQFTGRIALTVTLPEKQDETDLLNVARHHFPDLTDDAMLKTIVGAALQTETFLPTVENLAMRVRSNARDKGRNVPTLDDFKLAISEVLGMTLDELLDLLAKAGAPAAATKPQPSRWRRGPLLAVGETPREALPPARATMPEMTPA